MEVVIGSGEAMNTVYAGHENRDSQNWIATAGRGALRVAWHTIRLPILTLLVLMEPLVCWLLSLARDTGRADGIVLGIVLAKTVLPVLDGARDLRRDRDAADPVLPADPAVFDALILDHT